MRNLKSKFIKEIEVEISDSENRIKELLVQHDSIPKRIQDIEHHIGNLKTLCKTVEKSETPFQIYDLEYINEDEEYI
jgi:hypothetical protein